MVFHETNCESNRLTPFQRFFSYGIQPAPSCPGLRLGRVLREFLLVKDHLANPGSQSISYNDYILII